MKIFQCFREKETSFYLVQFENKFSCYCVCYCYCYSCHLDVVHAENFWRKASKISVKLNQKKRERRKTNKMTSNTSHQKKERRKQSNPSKKKLSNAQHNCIALSLSWRINAMRKYSINWHLFKDITSLISIQLLCKSQHQIYHSHSHTHNHAHCAIVSNEQPTI